ncbi:lachrymatory-factor synthase isoform X1 [Selaginella moellendorffii]|nr:lachrymatory-factor synthase isoform X1 [Selaginella moellendorffii]|eukprot:XP_024544928.1 lachrymatory-factor synthase isoform X1 [Selaginella moellendorffii]
MAEPATSPSRRASVDSVLSDFQVELLKQNHRQQILDDDEFFLDDHPKSGQNGSNLLLDERDASMNECSTSSPSQLGDSSSVALWQGGIRLVIEAPIAKVWEISSERCGISRWMPMIEECVEIDPGDGITGSRRRISGDILPRIDNIQSWAIEKLVEFDAENHYYTYEVEESNIGLEGYRATLQLNDFGDDTTLVNWVYEVRAMEDSSEEGMADYMGMFFKACLRRLELLASGKERDDENTRTNPIGPD